jgi:predicted alpha-1,2-mannosidase
MLREIVILLVLVTGYSSKKIDYVDTLVGTGGNGYGIGSTPPGAQRPFGLARVGPDTVQIDDIQIPFNHFGGYYYDDPQIRLFSHTHMVGSGVLDYGTIGVMPIAHYPATADIRDDNFRSYYTHDEERAEPGYYKVHLKDNFVTVELTATEHVAAHRYTYMPGFTDKVVLFDISYTLHPKSCKNSFVTIDVARSEVSGWVLNQGGLSGRFGGYMSYFVAWFPEGSIAQCGTWQGKSVTSNSFAVNGTDVGGFVVLNTGSSNSVEFFVGLSSISIAQARENIFAQINGRNFDAIKTETQNIWESALNTIEVDGTADVDKFYTALYHAFMAPTIFDEAGGVYLGFDNKVHQLGSDQKHYYTDMSIWDVHRTEFPFLGLIRPDILSDIVKSLLLMYQQGGYLPRWPMANGYTDCMEGTHAINIIVDAYLRAGINDFDLSLAYKAMKQSATQPQAHAGRSGLSQYISLGYVPYDVDKKGAVLTQSFAYDDWALANYATALNLTSDAQMFYSRSKNYKNVWNSQYKFFCPKTSSGKWECPETWLNVFDERYVEGDAWHYRWYAPQDIAGLINMFGGKEAFVGQLTYFFDMAEYDPFNVLPNPYYWAGNEPDILSAYLFNFAGRADLTQKYARWYMHNKFTMQPDGIPGNDDYGTMSSWFMFSALGFYPLAGSDTYIVGSPLFNNVTIHRAGGDLTITAYNSGKFNIYVQKAAVNGVSIDMVNNPFFKASQISKKSTIEFWMSDAPLMKR